MAFRYLVRKKNYVPGEKHRISRSKVDLFLECPRCFYLDQRLGIARPSTYPLTLNIAVDELMKKEFDLLREKGEAHAIMKEYGIDAVPLKHKDLEIWRNALSQGIEYLHQPTGLSARGGVDDVWVNPKGEFIIVDYKATSKRDEITLDGDLGAQYKRQIEFYQWLFEKNGHAVSRTAYFVYVNGRKDVDTFDGKLEFDTIILPCEGNSTWVEPTLFKIKECLDGELPNPSDDCAYCAYRKVAAEAAVNGKKETGLKKSKTRDEEKQGKIFR